MGEVGLNSFNKGMMQDAGKTLPQDGSYLEGRNIRVVSNEDSAESGIAVNVDGNVFSFELEVPCKDEIDTETEGLVVSPCQMGWLEGGQLEYDGISTISPGSFISYLNLIYYYPLYYSPFVPVEGSPDLSVSDFMAKAYRCGVDMEVTQIWAFTFLEPVYVNPYNGEVFSSTHGILTPDNPVWDETSTPLTDVLIFPYLESYPDNGYISNNVLAIPENWEDYINPDTGLFEELEGEELSLIHI